MNLVQDGKFIFDDRRNPFAVTFTAEDAQKVVAACNAHDMLVNALTLLTEKVEAHGGSLLGYRDEIFHARAALTAAAGAA